MRFQSRYGGGGPSRAQTVFDAHEESAGLLNDDEGDEGRELEPGLSLGGAQDGLGSANGIRKVRDDRSDCLCTLADLALSLRCDLSRRPRPYPPSAASGPSRLRQQVFLERYPSNDTVNRTATPGDCLKIAVSDFHNPLFDLADSLKKKSPFPANIVRNQKYNFATFVPLVLYEQFKFFFNLYFLLVALSQFIPALKIGASRRLLNFACLR